MRLRIPGHSSQITFAQFQRYHNSTDDFERVREITGLSLKKVRQLKPETVRTIIRLFNQVLEKGEGVRPETFSVRIGWKRVKLGFIPDLNEITVGEWGDSDELQVEIFDHKNYSRVENFVGIMFRPVAREFWGQYELVPYDFNKVKHYAPYLGKITMDKVFGAMSFFLLISEELLRQTRESLITELTNQTELIRKLQAD